MAKFSVSEKQVGEVVVLQIAGELDFSSAERFGEAIEEKLGEKCKKLVIDVSGVAFVSSMVWGTIVSKARVMKATGGVMALCGLSGGVRDAYDIMEFRRAVPAYPDEAGALEALGRRSNLSARPKGDVVGS